MKNLSFTLIFLMFVTSSCNFAPKGGMNNSETITDQLVKYTIPDTIKMPGGFYIGMTEEQIRSYAKNNQGKFYTNNNQLLKFLHTRLFGIDYNLNMHLYKGKLKSIIYIGDGKWSKIDDPGLQEHYKKIYDLIKGLNIYNFIEDSYYKKFQVNWPYSAGIERDVLMAKFCFGDKYTTDAFDNFFGISITGDDRGRYAVDIFYAGADELISESTLSKSLYFD